MSFRKAILNDIPITTTANLDYALRHLRYRVSTRLLWVDAISINQSNTQERNDQVQMMGKIYSIIRRVVVWIGPVDDNDIHLRAILAAMQFHFSDGNPSTVTLFDYACSLVSLMNEQVGTSEDPKECVLDALFRIVSRPWFQRIWVVQELALSRIATVHIGSYSFPWQPFEDFVNWLPHHKVDLGTRSELVDATIRVAKINCPRHFPAQLCRTLHLSATDPRDKVFSIVGISEFLGTAIKPDYTKSVQRVFSEAMCSVIQHEYVAIYLYAPLHSLQGICLDHLPGLPSWIPDFRIPGAVHRGIVLCGYENNTIYDDVYHRPSTFLCGSVGFTVEEFVIAMSLRLPFPSVRLSLSRNALLVPGTPIGTIAETSGSPPKSPHETVPVPGLPQHVCHFYHSITKLRGVIPSDFVWTVLSSKIHTSYDAITWDTNTAELFSLDVHLTSLSRGKRKAIMELRFQITFSVANKVLFVTETGQVGLSYHSDLVNGIRAGDLVVGLFGLNFPFILRARADDNGTHQMINVTGISGHEWGHEFLHNTQKDFTYLEPTPEERLRTPEDGSWRDYEEFGMKEYHISTQLCKTRHHLYHPTTPSLPSHPPGFPVCNALKKLVVRLHSRSRLVSLATT
ncbi:hypothetical protein CC86DRAFT_397899 [Ophiobolus disseminans]|uniref:Heterokaryon incompatibility domain-containing protein n=1 Tax=Ophiobolus disseminans TaxID=1469910 RepID=A0A6A6ZKG2_9PLEO|nr:hypothetical protein CC86DRAFT_397899 [Ophiobolus disseminans]